MRLHPELAAALRELKGNGAQEDEPVFKSIPRIERFRRDLVKAGIAQQDCMGRKAVFHSLRHTFGTNLARGGVASRVAMALMRHSDRRLTDKVYTDENLLGTWGAIDALPSYATPSSIASSFLGAEGQSVSMAGATSGGAKVDRTIEKIGQSHVLTQSGTQWHLQGNGGSGGARTRNLCRDRAAL